MWSTYSRRFLLLCLAWMLLMYGHSLLGSTAEKTPLVMRHLHVNNGLFGFLNFLLFFIAIHWPIPQFLQRRYWLPLLVKLAALMAAFILLKYFIAHTFFPDETLLRGTRNGQKVYVTFPEYIISGLWANALIVMAAFAYVFFFSWLEEDKHRKQLALQKEQAEFAFLKMQLNTHFLINSLNSIYSLALVRSPQVVDATRTLTNILEYMTDQPPVTEYRGKMTDEIRYLEDYIALQRLRTGCDTCVQLYVEGDPSRHEIAPLLLVPFVENAFKHGIAHQPDRPVSIRIHCMADKLLFTVHNFKAAHRRDKTGGIGLHNVRKRLALVYPDRYTLNVEDTEKDYCCNLIIVW